MEPTGQTNQGQGKQAMVVELTHRVPTTHKSPTCTPKHPQGSALDKALVAQQPRGAVWQPTLDPTGQTNQGQGKQAMVVELTHRVPTTCKSPTCTPKQPQRSALGKALVAQQPRGAARQPTLQPTGQTNQGQGKQAMVVELTHRVPTTWNMRDDVTKSHF